jgi:hypothetical protein
VPNAIVCTAHNLLKLAHEGDGPASKRGGSLRLPPALISTYWTLVRVYYRHKWQGLLASGFVSCLGSVHSGEVHFRQMALVKSYVASGRCGRTNDVRSAPSPMRGHPAVYHGPHRALFDVIFLGVVTSASPPPVKLWVPTIT